MYEMCQRHYQFCALYIFWTICKEIFEVIDYKIVKNKIYWNTYVRLHVQVYVYNSSADVKLNVILFGG